MFAYGQVGDIVSEQNNVNIYCLNCGSKIKAKATEKGDGYLGTCKKCKSVILSKRRNDNQLKILFTKQK